MKFTILEAEQRSDEWFAARAGRLTGSRAGDLLAKIKTGEAAARRDLRLQLVCERLTGRPQEDGFINKEMQRGIDLESAARAEYEVVIGLIVRTTGFLAADEIPVGCSLDGDVDSFHGIVELKCPKSSTHLCYVRDGIVPREYRPQLRHNLWVSGAEWADFVSFDDRFPIELQLFRARLLRKDADIEGYEQEALAFLKEVDRDVTSVRTLLQAAA